MRPFQRVRDRVEMREISFHSIAFREGAGDRRETEETEIGIDLLLDLPLPGSVRKGSGAAGTAAASC